MTKLVLEAVSKAYGATVALSHGDLTLHAGEMHVLIGSNGSGKSTLCKIVAGSVKPDAGKILIDGKPVSISGPIEAKALGIGIFYQELSLAARRTVEENICLPDLPVKAGLFVDRDALSKRAARYIDMFKGVCGEDFSADTPVASLRADQRQLVEIMKTLATEAPILIFDEPTSALDRAQVQRFFEILADLKRQGRAMIFISHRMDEIFEIGDRVTVIRDGRTAASFPIAETDPSSLIRLMVGEQQPEHAESAPAQSGSPQQPAGDVVLSTQELHGPGFKGVSLNLRRGEILGLGGLHGQGQSSLLRSLFGANAISGGEFVLDGTRMSPSSPSDTIKRGVGYVSGDRRKEGAISGRSILENTTPVHYLRERLQIVRPTALKAKAQTALASLKTKFAGYADPISSLSGGNQQKVIIARWIIDKQLVLLLDDPTKGIDLAAKNDLFALIRQLAEQGMAIMLYSSEDTELLAHADRVLVFNGGQVTRELQGAERTRYNLYQAAYEAA